MRHIAWAVIVAALFQFSLAIHSYAIHKHRLAGLDFFSSFYIESNYIAREIGILTNETVTRRLEEIQNSTGIDPFTKIEYVDMAYIHYVPFIFMEPLPALMLYLLGNLACALSACILLVRTFVVSRRTLWILILGCSAPIYYNILHAHSGGYFLLAITAAFIIEAKRPILAAALFALFLVHKPYFLIVILLAAASRRFRFAAFTGLFTLVMALLDHESVFSFNGISRHLGHYITHGGTSNENMLILLQTGMRDVLYRFFHGGVRVAPVVRAPELVTPLYLIFASAVVGVASWTLWRRSEGIRSWGLIMATACIVSPSVGNYMLIYLLPPLVITGSEIFRVGAMSVSSFARSVFVVALIALCANFSSLRYPDLFGGVLPPFPPPELVGTVILWCACMATLSSTERAQ